VRRERPKKPPSSRTQNGVCGLWSFGRLVMALLARCRSRGGGDSLISLPAEMSGRKR
jgi:hypothetical protein